MGRPARGQFCVLRDRGQIVFVRLKNAAAVVIVTFIFGLLIGRARSLPGKRLVFWLAVAVNVGILGSMKWLAGSIGGFVIVGVSFFTLQAISYLADIFLGILQAERHLGIFSLYVAFFPKLLQGPIERGESLLPQLRKRWIFDHDLFRCGLMLFASGFLQKSSDSRSSLTAGGHGLRPRPFLPRLVAHSRDISLPDTNLCRLFRIY